MIWSVAWRNIWRNPFRSWVIIAATAIGMFAGIFSVTFLKGWMNQRLEAGVETEFSHLQLHHPSFLENYDVKMLISSGISISNQITEIPGINGASPRLVIQSMVSSAETGSGVKVTGIYPEREISTSNLHNYIMDGNFFSDEKRNPVVIGKKLAEKLKVKLKSKIILTFQDSEGNITSGTFRVCGIYHIVNTGFEEFNLFVKYRDLLEMVHLPEGVAHEITVHMSDPGKLEKTKMLITGKFPGIKVSSWQELSPEFGFIIELGDLYAFIVVFIVLLALGFGIVNTMLMVVLERVKELGMLMAVGMSKSRVFIMLMIETVLLTLTGGVIGITGGIVFCLAAGKHGIDLSMYSQGFGDIGRSSVVFPVVETGSVILISLLVITTGIMASVYPARKAIRFQPAEALRIDL